MVNGILKMYTLGKTSKEQLATVNPILQTLVNRSITGTTQDFGIIKGGGYRTTEQQYQYYLEGKSKVDGVKVVGTHQLRLAVDMIPYVEGKYTWEHLEPFKAINSTVMKEWAGMKNKEYNLSWGGNWKTFRDYPHYELRKK
jgi:peptidoglycan LD-endopeptidase CwlK